MDWRGASASEAQYMTGIRLSKLTDDVLLEIFQIYDRVTGGVAMQYWQYYTEGRGREFIGEVLKTSNVEWEFSSVYEELACLVVTGQYTIQLNPVDPVIFCILNPMKILKSIKTGWIKLWNNSLNQN